MKLATTPDNLAHELELINNRDMSELTAKMFMNALAEFRRMNPNHIYTPDEKKQIDRFANDL